LASAVIHMHLLVVRNYVTLLLLGTTLLQQIFPNPWASLPNSVAHHGKFFTYSN